MLARAIASGPACFQAIEEDSVAAAIVTALMNPSAAGAYNLAAVAPVGHERRRVMFALTAGGRLLWRARLLHADARWIDLVRDLPLVSSERAERELGWAPPPDSRLIVSEFMDAWHNGTDFPTPPLRNTSRRS
jgi:nucleoside-diphosphate-sugar epimerase